MSSFSYYRRRLIEITAAAIRRRDCHPLARRAVLDHRSRVGSLDWPYQTLRAIIHFTFATLDNVSLSPNLQCRPSLSRIVDPGVPLSLDSAGDSARRISCGRIKPWTSPNPTQASQLSRSFPDPYVQLRHPRQRCRVLGSWGHPVRRNPQPDCSQMALGHGSESSPRRNQPRILERPQSP